MKIASRSKLSMHRGKCATETEDWYIGIPTERGMAAAANSGHYDAPVFVEDYCGRSMPKHSVALHLLGTA